MHDRCPDGGIFLGNIQLSIRSSLFRYVILYCVASHRNTRLVVGYLLPPVLELLPMRLIPRCSLTSSSAPIDRRPLMTCGLCCSRNIQCSEVLNQVISSPPLPDELGLKTPAFPNELGSPTVYTHSPVATKRSHSIQSTNQNVWDNQSIQCSRTPLRVSP